MDSRLVLYYMDVEYVATLWTNQCLRSEARELQSKLAGMGLIDEKGNRIMFCPLDK